nr:sulfite exporter TauE/SafE family protein [Aeromicrobium duanguangcaii]
MSSTGSTRSSRPARRSTRPIAATRRRPWSRRHCDGVERGSVDWQRDLTGLLAGVVLAALTTPVGVSGAVFLLPFQLSVLHVPSPRVTPTNLLYNVVSGPGALVRFRRRGQFDRPLTLQLLSGSVPGVVLGALVRVHVAPDPDVFRLLAAAVLVPVGLFILRRPAPGSIDRRVRARTVVGLAFVVGIVGGVYGIGGGSVLGPILIGAGMSVARVAPAALLSTWVTSLAGVATYAAVSMEATGPVSPDWSLGIATGLGGLVGGWVGAWLQPRLPERLLRTLLGLLAVTLGALYVAQSLG